MNGKGDPNMFTTTKKSCAFALCLLAILVAGTPSFSFGQSTVETTYKLIVHTSNPSTTVTSAQCQSIFMKKTRAWPNGVAIQVVDQVLDAPARAAFSTQVLKKAARSVKNLWQQAIFSGSAIPPPELATDHDVIAFVARTPGAVGYVGAGSATAGVKVMVVRD